VSVGRGSVQAQVPARRRVTRDVVLPTRAIDHVVIVVKENHTFDNYFGTFAGANGATLPRSPNPPPADLPHTHAAWLTRATTSARTQFVEADIPAYFGYARRYALCDNYFTDVAGPSTPNHLMLLCADARIIDNPPRQNPPTLRFSSSLPRSLEAAGLTWRSYGGYAIDYMDGVNASWKLASDRFRTDAAAGQLPNVSWVYAPLQFDEHPPYRNPQGVAMGNVTQGMQWTVDQVNAIVRGGLWPRSAIFITWDDWGGWYDHVDPPQVEVWNGNGAHPGYNGSQFRYGSRVGCLVLGPYARTGYISKVLHSHVSLVKFCETTFGLRALNARDGSADDMSDCFDPTRPPALPPPASP
jgi:phospholipase C